MISGQVDKFYRKVIKDLIANLGKNESILLELEHNNIYLNQIEQKMTQKINNPNSLFKRLINNQNQIEKEMNSRFATMSSDPSYAPQHHHMMNQESANLRQSDQIHYSFSNDISLASNSLSNQMKKKQEQIQQNKVEIKQLPIKSEEVLSKKRAASQYSLEDLSDIQQDNDDSFKRLRQNAKVHILGTYQVYSKKHNFKKNKTDILLHNVFVKAQGMSRQFFLKTLKCSSRKKVDE